MTTNPTKPPKKTQARHMRENSRKETVAVENKHAAEGSESASSATSSVYRRDLHSSLVRFNSREGRTLFAKAMAGGWLDGSYWSLAENYSTQSDPSFCSLTTLSMVLNSLAVDPQRKAWPNHTIHGEDIPWRWFTEESLVSCCGYHQSLTDIRTQGMSFRDLAKLAACNNVHVDRVDGLNRLPDIGFPWGLNCTTGADPAVKIPGNDQFSGFGCEHLRYTNGELLQCMSEEQFRHDLRQVCGRDPRQSDSEWHEEGGSTARMIVSFSREVLQQTGTGHFSPIGALEPESDMVLVMDVARFKYSPFWVPTEMLFKALCTVDETTNEPRGYMVLRKDDSNLAAAA